MSQETLSKIDESHINEISSSRNEPDWLKDYRKNSLSIYSTLPIEMSPLYNKYTDAKRLNPEKISIASTTKDTIPDFLQKRLGELENEICIIRVWLNTCVWWLSGKKSFHGWTLNTFQQFYCFRKQFAVYFFPLAPIL